MEPEAFWLAVVIVTLIFEPWSVRWKCRRTGCYKHHGEYSYRCPQRKTRERCARRWCLRRVQRMGHVYLQAGSRTIRFGRMFCAKHADESDAINPLVREK